MKLFVFLSLLISALLININAHAEGNCPQGEYPIGGGNGGWTGCAPIPGYWDNQQQPAPPRQQWSDRYGAVVTDSDLGIIGISKNMLSRTAAEQAALNDCQVQGGQKCELENWHGNGCVAMIVGDKKHTTNSAETLDEAIQKGMKKCNRDTANCKVYYSACSLPVRIQ